MPEKCGADLFSNLVQADLQGVEILMHTEREHLVNIRIVKVGLQASENFFGPVAGSIIFVFIKEWFRLSGAGSKAHSKGNGVWIGEIRGQREENPPPASEKCDEKSYGTCRGR